MSDCIDADEGSCAGQVFERYTLSRSGMTFPRCDHHYDAYVERTQPIIDDIDRRYPATAPADLDPSLAGEVWSEDEY